MPVHPVLATMGSAGFHYIFSLIDRLFTGSLCAKQCAFSLEYDPLQKQGEYIRKNNFIAPTQKLTISKLKLIVSKDR